MNEKNKKESESQDKPSGSESELKDLLCPGKIEAHTDFIAEKLDEMADLCEHWRKNRERGRMPNAIRAALMMLAKECIAIEEQDRRLNEAKMNSLCGPEAFARNRA